MTSRRRLARPFLVVAAAVLLIVVAATSIDEWLRPDMPATWQDAWDAESTTVLEAWFRENTGPTSPSTATVSGTYTVASQKAADDLVGRTVVGQVVVSTSDVTLRDFTVVADGAENSAIYIDGGLSGVLLEAFEVDCQDLLQVTAGVSGGTWANVSMRRAHIHSCLDGVRLFEGSTYEHLYIHDSTAHPEPYGGEERYHADAVQVVRGRKPILLRRSFLDHSVNGPNTTGVVMCSTDAAPISGLTIQENHLNGAGYTITVEATDHGVPTDVAITNNRFGRDYKRGLWSGSGVSEGANYQRTGNVFADTFEPVPLTWGELNRD